MRQFFITIAGVLTALLIAVFIVPFILVAMVASSVTPEQEPLPERKVVVIDLSEQIFQQPVQNFFAFADGYEVLTLASLHDGLKQAAEDETVEALYIRGGMGFVGSTTANEILEAMAPFKASGKPVYGYTQDIAPEALGDYQVLAQADTVWMQPTGSFMPAGLSARLTYARDALDQIGVTAEKVAFSEYKGAMDTFTDTQMSEPQREANQRLVDVIYSSMADSITAGRDMSVADLDAALAVAPFGAVAAVEAKLIDKLAYEREVADLVLGAAGDDADFVSLASYAAAEASSSEGDVIAVVYGQGAIVSGESPPMGPFGGEPMIGSDTMATAILDAADDEEVKAIVVRIDSPGGSASASDQVWDAIRAVQARDIPVIASMGSVAASGGYYIPAGADVIVAHPTTVTGSIGVIGAKFSVGGLFEKIGVNVDAVSTNDNADIWAMDTRFSDPQRARFTAWLGTAYEDFKDRVAGGRNLSAAETEEIARGRVWAGVDAMDKGLVDKLGGFSTTIEAAREVVGIEEGAPVQLRTFPKPRTFQEELFGFALNAEAVAKTLVTMSAIADHPEVSALVKELATDSNRGLDARARVPEMR
ncbi:signal peptide peptidase SppA [Pyruvatibacter sp.]